MRNLKLNAKTAIVGYDKKMSKQKTAMKKLIDYMEENCHLTEESRYEFKKALEEEVEQIKVAFVAGDERGTKDVPFNAEQYFLQVYGWD